MKVGLQAKFIVAISVIVIITATILTAYFVKEQQALFLTETEAAAGKLALSYSFKAATEPTALLKKNDPEVVKVSAFDMEKKSLYTGKKGGVPLSVLRVLHPDEFVLQPYSVIWDKPLTWKNLNSVFYIVSPIFDSSVYDQAMTRFPEKYAKKDIHGFIVLTLSTAKLVQKIKDTVRVSGLLTLGVILLGILGSILMTGPLIRPIKALVNATKRVTQGDYSARTHTTLRDEIGALAKSFNTMTEKIQYVTSELNQYSHVLEEKVAARTQELATQNMALESALVKAKESDRLKSEFLANMSHELRTPLNAIIGFSDILLQGVDGPVTKDQKNDLQLINQSGKHLLTLISGILDIAKIESGKMEFQKETVDLNKIIHDVVSVSRALTNKKPITLKTAIAEPIAPFKTDGLKLQQILLNLVSNAIKFTNEGEVGIYVSSNAAAVIFEVRDTGIGIAKEDIPKMFEKFRQLDGSFTRAIGGTGIGLSIVKELILMQDGHIWVESTLGKGTSVFFSFPLT